MIIRILGGVERHTDIKFLHALTGNASSLSFIKEKYPEFKFIALSKKSKETLPEPDFSLLARLESFGVPTVRSMIQGDPYLRYLPERIALGYATLIALQLNIIIKEYQPDIILASFDRLHSAMALAVAKSLNIPFVALAFPLIPDNLSGFCNALTPNSLVPIVRSVNSELRNQAFLLMQNVRTKRHNLVAYRAPFSTLAYVRKLLTHCCNYYGRVSDKSASIDEFSAPLPKVSVRNILRRTINRTRLPVKYMLKDPPSKPYLYFPMHMAPESSIDTWAPFYQNQLALVAQVAQATPIDLAFVVKLHFSDPDNYSYRQLKELMSLPNMHIAHPNASGSAFLEKATLVVGITGTSCLEAALLGKPVLIFGDTPYVNFPRSERAELPDRLYGQIRRMLVQPPPTDTEIVEAYASYLARYMPGLINDWSRCFTEDELHRLSDCFRDLVSYVSEPDSRLNWYKTAHFSA